MTGPSPGTIIGDWIINERFTTTGNSIFYNVAHRRSRDTKSYLFKWAIPGSRGSLPTEFAINDSLQGSPNTILGFSHLRIAGSDGFFLRKCRNSDLYKYATSLLYRPSEELALGLSGRILRAIEYIHGRRIAHRDVKLDNILLDGIGWNGWPLTFLADFGLAKAIPPEGYFMGFCGTKHNAAPEVFWGESYTELADLWSFGICLYELATLQYPFGDVEDRLGDWTERLVNGEYSTEGLSPELADVMAGLLDVNPQTRLTAQQALRYDFFAEDDEINRAGEKLEEIQRSHFEPNGPAT